MHLIRSCIIVFVMFVFVNGYAQSSNPLTYCMIVKDKQGDSVKLQNVSLKISIANEDSVIFRERQIAQTDSSGKVCLDIGTGEKIFGKLDSIIWALGTYYLIIEDSLQGEDAYYTQPIISLRTPEDLDRDHDQGVWEGVGSFGQFAIENSRKKRPKKVVVDLTSSYVNLAYPANTYPIFRHFEWSDPDTDGLGSTFILSFSENTKHAFIEKTAGLGDVALYSIPFQHVIMDANEQQITINITEPLILSSYGQTYKVKGPWNIIYYFEW